MIRLLKFLDATAGAMCCWLGGLILHLSHRTGPNQPAKVQRILVVRPGGMGDMILLQPMLRSLRGRYPEAEIDLVCERRNREILSLAGQDVGILLYDANPVGTLLSLIRRHYDLAIDSEQFHNFSAVMVWLSGAPVRIGFKINPGRNPIYTHLVNYDLEGYEADEFMRLLHPLGIRDGSAVSGMMEHLRQQGEIPATPVVLIHAGTSTRYKEWAPSKYAELARRVVENMRVRGIAPRIALVGGAGDVALAQRIAALAEMGGQLDVMAGDRPLAETVAMIAHATLFIGGDSGLSHLAVALGTPSVVLFGPSDPRKWGFTGKRHVVVCKERACSPCFIFGYHKPCHDIGCMADITVDDVMAGVSRVELRDMSS